MAILRRGSGISALPFWVVQSKVREAFANLVSSQLEDITRVSGLSQRLVVFFDFLLGHRIKGATWQITGYKSVERC
jgi:hypothetical protein